MPTRHYRHPRAPGATKQDRLYWRRRRADLDNQELFYNKIPIYKDSFLGAGPTAFTNAPSLGDKFGVIVASSQVFQNVNIPYGATINYAQGTIFADDVVSPELISAQIWCEASDTATPRPRDPQSVPLTTATVILNSGEFTGVAPSTPQVFDFTVCMQEVVNRPGWEAGNEMCLITKPGPGSPSSAYMIVGPATLNLSSAIISWHK